MQVLAIQFLSLITDIIFAFFLKKTLTLIQNQKL